MEIYYDVGDHLGDFRALGLEGCDFVGGLDCGKQRRIDGGCDGGSVVNYLLFRGIFVDDGDHPRKSKLVDQSVNMLTTYIGSRTRSSWTESSPISDCLRSKLGFR